MPGLQHLDEGCIRHLHPEPKQDSPAFELFDFALNAFRWQEFSVEHRQAAGLVDAFEVAGVHHQRRVVNHERQSGIEYTFKHACSLKRGYRNSLFLSWIKIVPSGLVAPDGGL